MKYYVHYADGTGNILGVYTSDVHSSIPNPNIEITEAQWQMVLRYECVVQDGAVVMVPMESWSSPPLDLGTSASARLAQIDLESIAPLRTLVLDLARGITMPDEAVVARVKLQELEDRYHANL